MESNGNGHHKHNGDKDPTNGQFVKGNKGSLGKASHRRVAAQQFKEILLRAVTKKDIIDAVRCLMKQVRAGDVAAIKLFFDRTIGPVTDKLDVSGSLDSGGRILVMLPPKDSEQ